MKNKTNPDPLTLLPPLHTGQQHVLATHKRFNLLIAGRRWFKTSLAAQIALDGALHGKHILWGAPTYDQARIGFDWVAQVTDGVAQTNKTRLQIRLPGDGWITFRSFHKPDNARGYTVDGVVIDEAADVQAATWREVLRPMLITSKGWAWIIGTPKGRGWVWQEWQRAADRTDYARWQAPTLGATIIEGDLLREPHPLENTTIDFAEIRDIFQTVPERTFRQEILAEFVTDGGGVFRGLDAACILYPAVAPHPGHRYVMGVDWGRSNDFTVISVLDATMGEQVAIDRFTGIGWDVQRGRVRALAERWLPSAIIAEENSIGGPNIEALIADGLTVQPFYTTSRSKDELIGSLTLALERGELKLLIDPAQLEELAAYELTRLSSGAYRYSAPSGGHDDRVMALALAWYGVRYGAAAIAFARP